MSSSNVMLACAIAAMAIGACVTQAPSMGPQRVARAPAPGGGEAYAGATYGADAYGGEAKGGYGYGGVIYGDVGGGGATYGGATYGGATDGGATYGGTGGDAGYGDASYGGATYGGASVSAGEHGFDKCRADGDCTVFFAGRGCLPSDPRAIASAQRAAFGRSIKWRPEACGIGGRDYEERRQAIEGRYAAQCAAKRCQLVDHGPQRESPL